MPRYFLEVAYKGTNYSGFQVQQNANTIQAEIEKAIYVLLREKVILTGSSRTDSGVHALQNFFHFDTGNDQRKRESFLQNNQFLYKINAILPHDIVVKNLFQVSDKMHCRFDALSREYKYYLYQAKNPFVEERAFFYPYRLNIDLLQKAAEIVKEYNDFTSFSKRNTQAKTFNCHIEESRWIKQNSFIIYNVKANRFLRGMVRALTATMLKVGREKITLEEFRIIIENRDSAKANFNTPPHGLFLVSVKYPFVFER